MGCPATAAVPRASTASSAVPTTGGDSTRLISTSGAWVRAPATIGPLATGSPVAATSKDGGQFVDRGHRQLAQVQGDADGLHGGSPEVRRHGREQGGRGAPAVLAPGGRPQRVLGQVVAAAPVAGDRAEGGEAGGPDVRHPAHAVGAAVADHGDGVGP